MSLFLACLRKLILLTPLAIILPIHMGVDGIYQAEPISDLLSALTALTLYIRFAMKNYGLEKSEAGQLGCLLSRTAPI